MKPVALAALAALIVSGCGGYPALGPDYSKNERLQLQLDQMIAVRDEKRESLKDAVTENDRYKLRGAIQIQNELIAQIKVQMGYPPGPVEPIEVETGLAGASEPAVKQPPPTPVVTTESSEFTKFVKLQAPVTKQATGRFESIQWTPSALISKEDGSIKYYIHYFEIYSADRWKSWTLASTDKSESLPVTQLTSEVISCRGGCSYSEQISIDIPNAIAERSGGDELRIQLRSRSASTFIFSVPPSYFGQLVERANAESALLIKPKAPAPAPAAKGEAPTVPSAVDELQKLAKLKADGVITEKEFQALKAKIIAK